MPDGVYEGVIVYIGERCMNYSSTISVFSGASYGKNSHKKVSSKAF